MSPLILILGATAIVSYMAFSNTELKTRLMLLPMRVHHHGEWWRVLSHGLVHSDTMHLLFNLFVLWQFGTEVESALERGLVRGSLLGVMPKSSFWVLYVGGLLAGALPAMIRHRNNSSYASLGASGAVSGVLIAFIVLYPTSQLLLFFIIPMPAIVAGIAFFWFESRMDKRGKGRIAHDAHFYGGAWGLLFILVTDAGALPRLLEAVRGIW